MLGKIKLLNIISLKRLKNQNNTTFLGTERPEAVFGFGWVANVGRKRWDF